MSFPTFHPERSETHWSTLPVFAAARRTCRSLRKRTGRKTNCDPDRTDHTMNRLDAAWYRKVISRHFINCGGGVFVPKGSDVCALGVREGLERLEYGILARKSGTFYFEVMTQTPSQSSAGGSALKCSHLSR